MDCGLGLRKVQGLFCKSTTRKGIGRSRPSDQGCRARIRPGEGERRILARTVTPAVRRHCRRRGGLGRARLGARVHQMKNRAHRGMRGKKGVSAMPIRRPGTAGSAVAAMAGGQGLRSSRPGHLEAKKNENNGTGRDRGTRRSSPREKWRRGRLGDGCSRGGSELGDGGSRRPSAAAVVASATLGECKEEAGRQQGCARGSAAI